MNELENIGIIMVAGLAEELRKQGHVDTGKLIRDMSYNVRTTARGAVIEIEFQGYGLFVNAGRLPGKYVPFQILFDWVKRKLKLSGAQAKSATFAINRKIYNEGIPTAGSLKFSQTGKRTEFIQDTWKDKESEVAELAEKYFTNEILMKFERLTKYGIYDNL